MGIFPCVAALFLIKRLQKVYKFTAIYAKWSNQINLGFWAVIGIFVLSAVFLKEPATTFINTFLLVYILLFVRREPDFEAFHFFVPTYYPLLITCLISGIAQLVIPLFNKDFYNIHNEYFQLPVTAAFVWIFARWATSKKQQKELKAVSEKNAQLDLQVAERTAELTKQKNELQETVKLLQATQAQLIQQEKLASLGELTAGIAHEIQNPLNFVNNFSEVSIELLDEMEEEFKKGDTDEAIAIASDIKQNLQKIIHHGKRADGIVKGMLLHSRNNTGDRQLTDINALADEYFRLSYHGLRAKDKSFNANMVTDFSPDIPQLNIVPQDVGRVLLNLFNNAFYAVQHKQKIAGADYKPTVKVSTVLKDKVLQIAVWDNGTGIPDAVKDKILQPFFTTKPTGEGTGLGLSLSYDIVVKGHGGKIEIDSKEGEYTQFTVLLPV